MVRPRPRHTHSHTRALLVQLKLEARRALGVPPAASLPLPWQVATASAAGAVASFVTSPLDLTKLRLQVQRGLEAMPPTAAAGSSPVAAVAPKYRNLLHGMRVIVATEGWRAMFRGSGSRVAFHAASTAVSLPLFERCRDGYAWLLRAR